MLWGTRWQLTRRLLALGFSETIQTALIERLNLILRQGVAALSRRTWSKARSNEVLHLRVQWWRRYYPSPDRMSRWRCTCRA
jgi:IS1 family transposase